MLKRKIETDKKQENKTIDYKMFNRLSLMDKIIEKEKKKDWKRCVCFG